MLFSVIIPAYNAEEFISSCVNSILRQDFPREEFEIIVVDDCSPDGQAKVLKSLCETHPTANIRVIDHTENLKQGGARNTGNREARGRWIFFLDADDYWVSKDVFNVFSALVDKFKDISVIESVSFENTISRDVYRDNFGSYINEHIMSGIDFFTGSGQYAGYVWTAAYRKDFIKDYVFREKVFFEDGDWKLKVFLACPKMAVIDFPFYAYVSNPNSTIRSWRKEVFWANVEVNRIIHNLFMETYKDVEHVKTKGIERVKRNIFSWFKLSKGYSIRDSYQVLDYASSTELFNLSNYTLTTFERIALLFLKHFTLATLLSIRCGVYARRGLRKFMGNNG